ncbi:glycosyltransferase [Akkermansiaceae bacterium]|nr:glycosyltransferase [Akkermansiaceae bacterium]
MEQDAKPLVTVILFTFNQEEYVKEAVESILEQTYQPLEVIISDDCSGDRTLDVIEAVVTDFEGPHSVRMNRNSENQGIGKHVSNMMEAAKGELIVLAAGDDVSAHNRVEVLVKAWKEGGYPAGVGSAVTMIDATGDEIGQREGFCGSGAVDKGEGVKVGSLEAYLGSSGFGLLGCSAAWSREILEVFGRLPDEVMNEDAALSLRALIMGGLLSINPTLVKYRVHGGNLWTKGERGRFKTILERRTHEKGLAKKAGYRAALCRLGLADFQLALDKGLVTQRQFDAHTKSLRLTYQRLRTAEEWWTYSFWSRLTHFTKLGGGFGTKVLKLFPFEVFLRVKNALF